MNFMLHIVGWQTLQSQKSQIMIVVRSCCMLIRRLIFVLESGQSRLFSNTTTRSAYYIRVGRQEGRRRSVVLGVLGVRHGLRR